ncbi:MAG: ATP-binding protein [Kiritimatiellia bacterium]
MTQSAACILLTSDADLARRLGAAAENVILSVAGTSLELARWRERTGPGILLLDLCHVDTAAVLADATPDARAVTVAFGLPESDPFLAAREAGLLAVEPFAADLSLLRATLRRAATVLRLQEEVRLLRQQLPAGPARAAPESAAREPPTDVTALFQFTRASRHFHDAQCLLDQVVEGIAAATRIARVGVFARLRGEPVYRLHASLRSLEGTTTQTFAPSDPFVRWLERHAHLVCRAHLSHVAEPADRLLLQRVLDAAGAEIIAPLSDRHGLLGWIFLGHHATGLPYTPRDLSDLAILVEYVATLLENALLYEEVALQKTLAENLLETIPVGIVAASEDGTVRWFNRAAEAILRRTAAETVNRPLEQTGSRLADLLRRALQGACPTGPVTWTDTAARRTVEADVHRIGADGARLGAMALLTDVTRERLLHEKQEEVDRHTFWNDLAAAMSHEIRNPLVAISTFAQLLPERHTDPEFRMQFHAIVTSEVQRLNAIIAQINAFAHPPATVFRPVVPAQLVELARAQATRLLPGENQARIECRLEPDLPTLQADEHALAQCLAYLLVNAREAVQGRSTAHVALHVRRAGAAELAFAVSDNGPGIASAMRDRIFSPFGTTKPRGLGLGLPLARRAAVDHGGRIDVDSTPNGTTVTVTLPLTDRRNADAETADR